MEPTTKEPAEQDVISIYDSSSYYGHDFDEWYKPVWFENNCDYDEEGHYGGDRYAVATEQLNHYIDTWSEVHGIAADSPEAEAEKNAARPLFNKKYIINDITPKEAEDMWDDFVGSDAYYDEIAFYTKHDWETEISNLNYDHTLPYSTYILTGSVGLWDGIHSGAGIWTCSSANRVGELIEAFVRANMDYCDYIDLEAVVSTGALRISGTHHDGSCSHNIYAVDMSKVVDNEGNPIDLEDYVELHKISLADCVGKVTASLASIVDHIYRGNEMDSIFKQ